MQLLFIATVTACCQVFNLFHSPTGIFTFLHTFQIENQSNDLLIDSGSSKIWIKPIDLQCSLTRLKDVKIEYVDGTAISGRYTNKSILLNSWYKEIPILEATNVYCPSGMIPTSGILGISPTSPMISNSSGVLSYYIWKGMMNATLVFGGIDVHKYSNELEWLPATPLEWRVDATITINDAVKVSMLIDTGTSFLVVSQTYFEKLKNQYQFELVQGNAIYQIPCDRVSALPTITITLASLEIPYDPTEYTFQRTVQGKNACLVGIQPANIKDFEMIVGNLFLSKIYTVMDPEHVKIGFARLNTSLDTSLLVAGDYASSPIGLSASLSLTPSYLLVILLLYHITS